VVIQKVGLEHETLSRMPAETDEGSGSEDPVHDEPLNCSTNGVSGVGPDSPTAMQKVTLVHETPRTAELGVAATDCITCQLEPPHSMIKGLTMDVSPDCSAPATQNDAVTQLTLKKLNDVAPGSDGNATGDQVEPFHISEEPVSPPMMPPPTAIHQVDVTHETLPV
jgi:hypothetical protein